MSLKRRMKRTVDKEFDRGRLVVVNGYEVTFAPTREEWYHRLPPDGKAAIVRLHGRIIRNDVGPDFVREAEGLVEAYPYAPVFYNYLALAYGSNGQGERTNQVIRDALARFPGYLFARVNHAERAVNDGDLELAEEMLGPEMELRTLYPGRKRFHVSEFTGYYSTVGRYKLARGDRAGALAILAMLAEVAPDESATTVLAEEVERDRALAGLRRVARSLGLTRTTLR
jgi:hypothetical protein